MSAPLFATDVLFAQRLLKSAGFYTGLLDGKYGPKTRAAEDAFHSEYERIKDPHATFDARSEKLIATLLPAMQVKTRDILTIAGSRENVTGLHCSILSGTRTWAEQDQLFSQRPKVTNAKGGQSWHNFGLAIDLGLFQGSRYLTGSKKGDDKAYVDLNNAIKAEVPGLEFGMDWVSFKDLPHIQLATGKSLAQVRQAFAAGLPLTA